MKPLDPQSRRVIDAASSADVPAPFVEDELWQALSKRMEQPLPATAEAALRALSPGAKLGLLSGATLKLLIGAGIIGGLLAAYGVRQLVQVPPSGRTSGQHAPSAPEQAEPALQESKGPTLEPAQPRAASSLLEEASLLSRAQRALNGGRPARALALLAQHRERFPEGEMAQERDAAGVFALCALGHNVQAHHARELFLHRWPDSPLRARILAGCLPARRPH